MLEEEERSKPGNNGSTPLMDKTLDTLDTLSRDPALDKTLAEMLQSLVKLRKNNWGHSPPGSVAGQDSQPGVGTFSLDPTFYAPDGQVCHDDTSFKFNSNIDTKDTICSGIDHGGV